MLCSWFDIVGIKYSAFIVILAITQLAILTLYSDYKQNITVLSKQLTNNIVENAVKRDEYRVLYNFHPDSNFESTIEFLDVTLATQCSVNNIHYLIETLTIWTGPISVALFVPGESAVHAELAAKFLKKCFPKKQILFHLVYPELYPPSFDGNNLETWERLIAEPGRASCRLLPDTLRSIEGRNYAARGIPYPQNTLRNVAKNAVRTKYMLLLDVDVMPSFKLRSDFLHHALKFEQANNATDTKVAYIPPAFEAKHDERIPGTKSQLLVAWKINKVRPFYIETCPSCHKPARFDDWKAISVDSSFGVAYEAQWQPSWEPFYISITSETPDYDERFKQYGYDRISQNCEMYLAGFSFQVLSNSFVVHKGFKERGKFHTKKEEENRRNFRLFQNDFIPEMSKKYLTAGRECLESSRREGKAKITFRHHFNKHSKEKMSRAEKQVEL